MKNSVFKALVFICLVAVAASAASESCKGNPFTESLRTAEPLKVRMNPKLLNPGNFSNCQSEWNSYGTCCSVPDLLVFFELEAKLIDSNQDQLNLALDNVRESIEGIKDLLAGQSNTTLNQSNGTLHNLEEFESLHSFDIFKQDSKECWEYMKKVRGSALCSICSGRSYEFFSGNKILITPETCKETVQKCSNFFTKLSKITSKFPKVVSSLNELNFTGQALDMKKIESKLELYSPPAHLLQAFKAYEASKNDSALRDQQASHICSMITNVRKKPYIMVMDPSQIEAVASASKKSVDILKQERAKRINNVYRIQMEKLKRQAARLNRQKYRKIQIIKRLRRRAKNAMLKKSAELARKRKSGRLDNVEENTKKKYKEIEQNQKLQLEQWHKKEAAKEAGTRLLTINSIRNELLVPTAGLFESDSTVLVKTDSMFTSFDGGKGTTLDTQHSAFRAVNMSLAFP